MSAPALRPVTEPSPGLPGPGVLLRAPRVIADTSLSRDMLCDLCARMLMRAGRSPLRAIAGGLRLPPSVVNEVLAFMRTEQLVELVGHRGLEVEAEYQLSAAGQRFASDAFNRCHYVGPAPVTLADYCDQIKRYGARQAAIDAGLVHTAFLGIVVPADVLDQMGAAMNSGRAILVFGPAGSGKTYLAEHLASLQSGGIPVPYSITVGGEIIQVFDPLIHQPISPGDADNLVRSDRDERWQWCHRPVVISGGELTLQMLDLQFEPSLRFYQAPPHLKANGGLFVLDDLGRQLVSARDLMNRWIVPLDRGWDHLSLHTGFKFSIPFQMTVVFSTNLKPDDIADEAFLRRFGYKVYLGPLDLASYRRIFENVCASLGVEFDPAGFDWLIENRHYREMRPLLACYPRDLVGRVADFAAYRHGPARTTPEALAQAWKTYFTTAGAASIAGFEETTDRGAMQ